MVSSPRCPILFQGHDSVAGILGRSAHIGTGLAHLSRLESPALCVVHLRHTYVRVGVLGGPALWVSQLVGTQSLASEGSW